MIELNEEVKKLLKDKSSIKILATIDEKGYPHVVIKDSMTVLETGEIAYAEDLDSSISNKNMVRSIWFDKPVSINVSKGNESYQIKGRPKKCIITGPLFKEFLLRERERTNNKADIQSVWIISAEELRNQNRELRRDEEWKKRPYFNIHLDRLKK
ncbi:MAG: hypothetical protein D6734_11225 [Candidatus Schekmanbacteria bacterium]|nr:MAG: hypothetical protein D6734_11225 [Candidatus Schekmanbacteria bacterium]